MSTRSTIALEYANGGIRQIYCHWDGYIENNGRLLSTHYTTLDKIEQLIDLGDLSSLGVSIGQKHDFFEYTKDCTFYGRDRGERDTGAEYFNSYEIFLDKAGFQEYNYLFRNDGKWYVSIDGKRFVTLEPQFKKLEIESLK